LILFKLNNSRGCRLTPAGYQVLYPCRSNEQNRTGKRAMYTNHFQTLHNWYGLDNARAAVKWFYAHLSPRQISKIGDPVAYCVKHVGKWKQ
jgi:hypothetical protein